MDVPPPSRQPDLSPSLRWALSRILPGREETWLLRAILHRGPSAAEAWDAFTSAIQDLPSLFRTDTGGRKRLSPLLLASIRENGLPADPGLMTVLKTAHLREELRAAAFRSILKTILGALTSAEVPFLVLKGAALAETVYREPTFRHAHDIDLLLREEDGSRAVEALGGAGLGVPRPLPRSQGIGLRHRSDTPVLLLNRLYRYPFYLSDFEGLWERSRQIDGAGLGPLRIPSSADSLLHALGHASYCPSRSTLVWVTDAWMLLHAPEAVHWEDLAETVGSSLLELPAFLMLQYLREHLRAPVPRAAMEDLAASAAQSGSLRRDVALYGARQQRGRHPQLSGLGRPGWTDRFDLLRWQVFPSREYLRWAYGNPAPVLIPAIYLMRPFTYFAESLKWRALGLLRSRAAD